MWQLIARNSDGSWQIREEKSHLYLLISKSKILKNGGLPVLKKIDLTPP